MVNDAAVIVASGKPLEQFCAGSKRPSGRGSYCKDCYNVRSKASSAKRIKERHGRAVVTPRVVPEGHRYCPDCGSVRLLAEYHLRRRYGIGQVEFNEMLAEQRGVCAICGAPDPQHVDHDHRSGWVRGILCFNCNGGLGQFRDNPVFLAEAITYLKGTTWQRALIHPGVFQMCSPTRGRPPSRSS